MKLNEILLIGGALLAALVLSKDGAVSSILQNASVSLLPNQNENKKQITQIDITQQLRNISSLELEKNLEPFQKVLSQTQDYISDQEKIINKRYGRGQQGAFLYASDVENIQNQFGTITDQNTIQYYENNPEIRTQGLTNQYNILIARRNVGKAEEILNRQQGDIDLINEEYQTRFGGLGRYG